MGKLTFFKQWSAQKAAKSSALCPNCQVGAESLEEYPVVCPYLANHTGTSCSYYRPIKNGGVNKRGMERAMK